MTQSTVSLTLRADTSAFATSLQRAEQDFKSRFRSMGAVSKTQAGKIKGDFSSIGLGAQGLAQGINKAAKSFAIFTASAAGIGLIGKKMLNLADSTAKTADRIGFSTDSLQELRLAASLTGVSQEKLESSLERFTKRLGEAANGTGIAAKTYEQLGIRIKNTDGSIRDSNDVLNEVADAMQAMGTQAEKAAVAAALFGREGVALSLTMKDGSKGLNAFRQRARELGLVIDESLLRSAETANDQLDVLARTLKAQLTTAIVSFAPAITRLSQGFIDAIPTIKGVASQLVELKGAFILLGKSLVVSKLAGVTKSFAGIAVGIQSATSAVQLFNVALKKIAVAAVIGVTTDRLIKLGSLVKQHLDIKEQASSFIQAQQDIMQANIQSSQINVLNKKQFLELARTEQQGYLKRLESAKSFWDAKLKLEARSNFESKKASEAARINRQLGQGLNDLKATLNSRLSLETNHANALKNIQNSTLSSFKENLKNQLIAYDESNNQLKALQAQRISIAKEFNQLITDVESTPEKGQELSVLDISRLQQDAQAAMKDGLYDEALNKVQKVKEVIRTLNQSGNVTKAYLADQAKGAAELADKIMARQIQQQENSIQNIKQKIGEIQKDTEYLKLLTVGFDIESATKSADELKAEIQNRLAANPLTVPVVTVPTDGDVNTRADSLLSRIPAKARGGYIMGPGTETSDSILARLSRGEFVLKAKAVKHYGLSFLQQLNQMQLPKFNQGGLVPPRVPVISTPKPSSTSVATLQLNLNNDAFQVQTQNVDVVQALTKAVSREALKSGRRL